HGLVDEIDFVDQGRVEHSETARSGEQVAATGSGRADPEIGAGGRARHHLRRRVLVEVARLQPRGDDGCAAALAQGLDIRGRQHRALLERAAANAPAVGEDRALGLAQRDLAELHAAAAAASLGAACSAWMIWAMIATAISAGARPPSGSPIGAWMRAISAAVKPASARRC